jgi:hypothetical protein
MAELPSGTVTFLFTDIEGSTLLLRKLGGQYDDVLAVHQRILRSSFEALSPMHAISFAATVSTGLQHFAMGSLPT